MKIINKIWILGLLVICASCNAWLDVAPEDRVMEKDLFKDREGFLTALNGVYIEMNSGSSYGGALSASVVDVMGQYYNSSGEHGYAGYAGYAYDLSGTKSSFDAIWQKTYTQIANLNAILEHCEEDREVLPDLYYNLIKGEALGLRAMFHFDMLRLFGPLWTDKTKESIPYMKSSDRSVQPLLPADSVMNCVMADFKEARNLLKDVDPVITEGARNYSGGENGNDLFYRQYRLNYFAIGALMARASLWQEDYANAKNYAVEVLEAVSGGDGEPLFNLWNKAYADIYPKDNIFYTEVLFALYNSNRSDNVYKTLFASDVNSGYILTLAGDYQSGRVQNMYDDHNDLRFKMWESVTKNNEEICYFTKYENPTSANATETAQNALHDKMIPLVRISELYLILAECVGCIDNQVDVALTDYLNPLRLARGCINVEANSISVLKQAITDEYIRDFIGEGQTFFYFKRNRMENIPDGTLVNGKMNMQMANYVVPLPDSEISQRD